MRSSDGVCGNRFILCHGFGWVVVAAPVTFSFEKLVLHEFVHVVVLFFLGHVLHNGLYFPLFAFGHVEVDLNRLMFHGVVCQRAVRTVKVGELLCREILVSPFVLSLVLSLSLPIMPIMPILLSLHLLCSSNPRLKTW